MSRFKRYFPIPYLMIATAVIVHCVFHLYRLADASLAWVGALVAIVPLVTFMLSLLVYRRARTGRNQYFVLVPAVLGTMLSFVGFESPASWYALFLGLIPSFLYLYWYSLYDRTGPTPLVVGRTLPELELFDADGNPVVLTEGKHGLYMFVRGNWCPLCMAQVKEIANQYRELEARGVEVFLIARQSDEHTRSLAKRFDAPIRFCSDADGALARKLGIEDLGGVPFGMEPMGYESDTILPTVVIVDANRRIIFADLTDSYRIRPEPSTFLAALDAST